MFTGKSNRNRFKQWLSLFFFHWGFWAIVNILLAFLVIFGSANSEPGIPPVKTSQLFRTFITVLPWIFLGSSFFALFVGTSDFFSAGEHSKRHTFLFRVIMKFTSSFAGFLLGCFIPILIWLMFQNKDQSSQGFEYFLPRTIAIVIFSMVSLALLNAAREMIYNVGKKNAQRILTGKYFHTKNEDWAFLFIDMKGSTELAEKMGSYLFARLVQRVSLNINRAADSFDGEVYKYLGDGAIICWKVRKSFDAGIIIKCFEEFLMIMNMEKSHIESDFGIIPSFKAGAHLGTVTVSEIGNTKREIAFYGDVVNTASRIESACNSLNKTFIVSDAVQTMINPIFFKDYSFEKLEEIRLRGKSDFLTLWAWDFSER